MLSLLEKASMPLLRVSSYGGGGVERKFKPFANKSVSDWVSFNEGKVTILTSIKDFSFRDSFTVSFFFYSFSFIRSPFPFQSIATNGILLRVPYMMCLVFALAASLKWSSASILLTDLARKNSLTDF